MASDELHMQYNKRREVALAMGGEAKLERRRNAGIIFVADYNKCRNF